MSGMIFAQKKKPYHYNIKILKMAPTTSPSLKIAENIKMQINLTFQV